MIFNKDDSDSFDIGAENHLTFGIKFRPAFIGIYLEKSSMYDTVAKELRKIPEMVRLNYTTGSYSMFAEIICKDITQLRRILHDELQKIKGIERTETLISLEESFYRTINVVE